MKHTALTTTLLLTVLCLICSAASASTWYVNGVNGSDSNNCQSLTAACKTIGHAISLASSGDSINVAAATYTENLTVTISLKILGSGAATTIIDGGGVNTVVTISNSGAHVVLSKVTIRNGAARSNAKRQWLGSGVYNQGTLTVSSSTISGNGAGCGIKYCGVFGGGIYNGGTLRISNTTISGNHVFASCGLCGAKGGGIYNGGTLRISNTTISGNGAGDVLKNGSGGGIYNGGAINNTTISGNSANNGGGLSGGGTLQNSIVANNSGGNCFGSPTSNGYNLSSDGSCNLSGPGDLNNVDPMLGPLQNNDGPTQTMALPSGSPAIDAGNPNGCTDGQGHLLKTDQRGKPRPDTLDTGGCDMGAYESQPPVMTGYCVTWGGYPSGCHKAFDPTACPVGRAVSGVISNSCGSYAGWSTCVVPGFEGGKCLVQ